MDIEGLGDKRVDQLVDRGLVRALPDLYALAHSALIALDRMGPQSAQKLLEALEHSKHCTWPRFLYALGIREVGEGTAQLLSQHDGDLKRLMRATVAELLEIPDIGPIMANHIHAFFAAPDNQNIIQALLDAGIHWDLPEAALSAQSESESLAQPQTEGLVQAQGSTQSNLKPSPLKGQVFVLTGTLSTMSREAARERLQALGAKLSEQVSARTHYLVVGADPGSKYRKAQALNIPILEEGAFLELLRHDPQ